MKNRLQVWILGALVFAIAVPSQAQKSPTNGILFLHIQVMDSTATLQKVVRRPGRLKTRQFLPKTTELAFRAVSASGDSLWEGRMDFPLQEKREYVDQQGRIRLVQEKVTARKIVIRMPYFERMRYVELSKIENVLDTPGRNVQTTQAAIHRRPLARVEIQQFLHK